MADAAIKLPNRLGTGLTYNGTFLLEDFGEGLSQVSDYDWIVIGFQKDIAAATFTLSEVNLVARHPEGMLLFIH